MSKHNEKARFSELDGKPAIERYSAGARLNHWVVAICFVLLALSGLAFFHPGTFWLSNLFGSGTWARILHPFIGVLMFISFCGLFVRFVSHNFLSKDDIHWIINFKDVISNNEAKIPPAGRYNAGQKFLFWALFWLMLGLMATGICDLAFLFFALFFGGADPGGRAVACGVRFWPDLYHHHSRVCGHLGSGNDQCHDPWQGQLWLGEA